MSEMTEVNHSRPSLNGINPLGAADEVIDNGLSNPLKTTIPMQEVSAVREEPIPATAHYLPSDDRSTAAAASAASEGGQRAVESMPGGESSTKATIEGPGHESDVRGLNGTGLASVEGQRGTEVTMNSTQSSNDAIAQTQSMGEPSMTTTIAESAPPASSESLNAPGSQNPFNASEEESMALSRLTQQSDVEPITPASSLAPQVKVQGEADSQQPPPSAVSNELDAVLSPVKVEGVASTLISDAQQDATSQNVPVVSAVDEPVQLGSTKVENEALPLLKESPIDKAPVEEEIKERPVEESIKEIPVEQKIDDDIKMEDSNGLSSVDPSIATPNVISSQGIAAPAVAGLGGVGPSSSQEEEPPQKRQRKSVSLGFNGNDAGKPILAGPEATSMTQAQIKFCQNSIKSLKSRAEAAPFQAPVDPIALNIPHYSTIITQPMDLGTIDIRLALTAAASKGGSKATEKTKQAPKWNLDPVRDVYTNAESFEHDVLLVFDNCIKFNGPDHPLSQYAITLKGVFEKQMKTLPSAITAAPALPVAAAPITAESEASLMETPTTPLANGVSRRPSDAASRPKRDIHPPAPKDLLSWPDRPASATNSKKGKKKRTSNAREAAQMDKVNKDQLKFVSKIIDDMHKLPLQNYAWVFFEKPSRDLDFAPSYYAMIKKPISLKEIKGRLLHNEYSGVEEVKEDMDMMLNNCFQFNPKDSDVWMMGQEVKKAWHARLENMPQPVVQEEEEAEEDEEEEDEEEAEAARIKQQIAALQAQLQGLPGTSKAAGTKALSNAKASLSALPTSSKKANKKRRPSESSGTVKKTTTKKARVPSTTSGGPSTASTETKKAKSKKQSETKRRDEDVREVTYEQKEELAAKITQLPDDRLDGALKIIAEDKPPNANEDEEIELDIDDLSPGTLYKLYRYVVRPKGKKPPSKVSASDGRKRGTGGVKRKNLDEGEEAARIARLQEQLQQFDNPEAGSAPSSMQGGIGGKASVQTGAHDDLVASESSSGEDSDESESDYE